MLLQRDDGEDMSLKEAEALCRFCIQVLINAYF